MSLQGCDWFFIVVQRSKGGNCSVLGQRMVAELVSILGQYTISRYKGLKQLNNPKQPEAGISKPLNTTPKRRIPKPEAPKIVTIPLKRKQHVRHSCKT